MLYYLVMTCLLFIYVAKQRARTVCNSVKYIPSTYLPTKQKVVAYYLLTTYQCIQHACSLKFPLRIPTISTTLHPPPSIQLTLPRLVNTKTPTLFRPSNKNPMKPLSIPTDKNRKHPHTFNTLSFLVHASRLTTIVWSKQQSHPIFSQLPYVKCFIPTI